MWVVDDDSAMRASVRALLESAGLRVETCASAGELLSRYTGNEPGCLVLDLRLPDMSGLQVHKRLEQRDGRVAPAVIITGYGDVPTAVEAIKRGAVDFLEKPFSPQRLLDEVQRAIARDEESRARAARLVDARAALSTLSPRERQVLDLLLADRSNKQIALELALSEKTVATHRANLLDKLGATSLLDASRRIREVLEPSSG